MFGGMQEQTANNQVSFRRDHGHPNQRTRNGERNGKRVCTSEEHATQHEISKDRSSVQRNKFSQLESNKRKGSSRSYERYYKSLLKELRTQWVDIAKNSKSNLNTIFMDRSTYLQAIGNKKH